MSDRLAVPFDSNQDHFVGNLEAPLMLLQYGDYQCLHSGEVYGTVNCLRKCLGDQLLFVFRHYPLPSKHSLSLEASMATEAAARQGKFWAMHNAIFENQRFLVRSSFSWFAEELGLDMAAYDDSREHKKLLQKVLTDFESGIKSKVDGTPTFFINGRKYTGAADFESLYQACTYTLEGERLAIYSVKVTR
jgi:protein-disulfide isomerase